MKRFTKKTLSGFTLTELLIVLGIIAILSAMLIPSIYGFYRDKKTEGANENSKLVFMSVQKYLNKCDYTNTPLATKGAAYLEGTYNAVTKVTTESVMDTAGASISDLKVDFSNVLSDEVRKGNWVAKINTTSCTVEYVVWTTESVTFVPADVIGGTYHYADSAAQDSASKSNKYVRGCYPLGT